MGEFVVEVPAGVKAGERFAASVGNGRKVTVRIFCFCFFILVEKKKTTIVKTSDTMSEGSCGW